METERFIRRIYTVEAVQITAENILEVVEWCGESFNQTEWAIKIGGQTAYVGSWVTKKKSNGQVEVFSKTEFEDLFVEARIKNGEST